MYQYSVSMCVIYCLQNCFLQQNNLCSFFCRNIQPISYSAVNLIYNTTLTAYLPEADSAWLFCHVHSCLLIFLTRLIFLQSGPCQPTTMTNSMTSLVIEPGMSLVQLKSNNEAFFSLKDTYTLISNGIRLKNVQMRESSRKLRSLKVQQRLFGISTLLPHFHLKKLEALLFAQWGAFVQKYHGGGGSEELPNPCRRFPSFSYQISLYYFNFSEEVYLPLLYPFLFLCILRTFHLLYSYQYYEISIRDEF